MGEHWPVLTCRQPWAFAIERGGKTPENRPRAIRYRRPLWLHSGARSRFDTAAVYWTEVRQAWRDHVRAIPDWPGLPAGDVELGRKTTLITFGAVTSLVEVTGCHYSTDCAVFDREMARYAFCTPWAVGRQFHIEVKVLKVLAEPLACRGALGLWRLPGEVEEAARAQLIKAGGDQR